MDEGLLVNVRSIGVFVSGFVMVFLFTGTFQANGVVFSDTVTELQTSNFFVGSSYVLQAAVAFMIAGMAGSVLEEVSNRVLGVTGGFLFGLGFICYALSGPSLWYLCAFMGVTAVGGGLLHFAVYMAYLEHFQEKFSVAFSAREITTYLGVSVMPPLMEILSSSYGSHGSYLILGAISWHCIICGILLRPAIKSFEKNQSVGYKVLEASEKCYQRGDLLDTSESKANVDHSFLTMCSHSSVSSHPNFAIFLVVHSIFYYSFTGWSLFLVPFGTSLGYRSDQAVYLSTAGGVGGFCGKLLAIFIYYVDRMNPISGGLLPSSLLCIGLVGYIVTVNYLLLMFFSFLCGFALAYADSALSAMVPRYVCRDHLRQGSAISYLYAGLFMQLGGSVSGGILDLTSSYTWLFVAMIVCQMFIGVLAVILQLRDSKVVECGMIPDQCKQEDPGIADGEEREH